MADNRLSLILSEHARVAYTSLSPEDRRIIDTELDRLLNWPNDESIRERARRLESALNFYSFQTSTDLIIAFQLSPTRLYVLNIFRRETMRKFEKVTGHVDS